MPLKDNVGAGGVPFITIALIALCLLTFCWQLTLAEAPGSGSGDAELVGGRPVGISAQNEFAVKYGVGVGDLAGKDHSYGGSPTWLAPVTAFFVGADLLHLGISLLFLWIFGSTIELTFGRLRYAALLLVCGFASIGAIALVAEGSDDLALGTSGALAGVLGAFAFLYRRANVVSLSVVPLFATLLEVPALLLIALWFVLPLIPLVGPLVDSALLPSAAVQYAGLAVAFAVGAGAGALARGRRITEPQPMPV